MVYKWYISQTTGFNRYLLNWPAIWAKRLNYHNVLLSRHYHRHYKLLLQTLDNYLSKSQMPKKMSCHRGNMLTTWNMKWEDMFYFIFKKTLTMTRRHNFCWTTSFNIKTKSLLSNKIFLKTAWFCIKWQTYRCKIQFSLTKSMHSNKYLSNTHMSAHVMSRFIKQPLPSKENFTIVQWPLGWGVV